MIRINLLPHRETKRKQQQKQFYILLGFVLVVGAAIWGAMHLYLDDQLQNQNGRNAYLESEIANVEKQIQEIQKLKEQIAVLLQRKKVVEALQANRAETVYLLDQMVRQLPDGVYLKGIQQKAANVTVNGYAQSNARVSTFMRNLESSPYLEKPGLIEIHAINDKGTRLSEFTLRVSLARARETTAGKSAARPGAAAGGAIPTAQVVAPAKGTPAKGAPAKGAPAQGAKK